MEEEEEEEGEGIAKEGMEVREESEEATSMVALLLPLDSLKKGLRGLAVEGEDGRRGFATCRVVEEEEEQVGE